ncbi:MAG: MFS transporter [Bacteroidota bacterium]
MEIPRQEQAAAHPHLPFNFTVGLFDGAFFGFAIGFASFVAVIPLFVKGLTHSALLLGLIPAIHNMGWQLPQLFTAGWVSRARRYKPIVMWMTIHERVPFLGLAAIAWFLPRLAPQAALPLVFVMLVWQGMGGGLTANAWQSMVSKVIPSRMHGTFFGTQSAAFNAMAGISAVASGFLLEKLDSPLDFTLCFLLASLMMVVSYVVIGQTREQESPPPAQPPPDGFWSRSLRILRDDRNFRLFVGVRTLSQFASMAFAFYLIYAVFEYGMNEALAGVMTAVLLMGQVIFSPIMGRLGDRWSHRGVMVIGALAAILSALLAWRAPSLEWFYLVFLLEAAAIIAFWTVPIALTVSFARHPDERPLYIGLSNTLIAPAAILAPMLGGWLADAVNFQLTFLVSAACGLLMALTLAFVVREPEKASG